MSLTYSPRLACSLQRNRFRHHPANVTEYTALSNLFTFIINSSAVLGLGNISHLGVKPVIVGKGVLFMKFFGIDVFDIIVN